MYKIKLTHIGFITILIVYIERIIYTIPLFECSPPNMERKILSSEYLFFKFETLNELYCKTKNIVKETLFQIRTIMCKEVWQCCFAQYQTLYLTHYSIKV